MRSSLDTLDRLVCKERRAGAVRGNSSNVARNMFTLHQEPDDETCHIDIYFSSITPPRSPWYSVRRTPSTLSSFRDS